MKTLIVDDNINVIECYKRHINQNYNYLVDFVANPFDAISLIKNNYYTRIVTEIFFKNCTTNGLEIIKIAKKQDIKERIILTSISHPIIIKNTGAILLLRKPITKNKIISLISEEMNDFLKIFENREISKTENFSLFHSITM